MLKLKIFLLSIIAATLLVCTACSNLSSNHAQVEQHLNERKAYWQHELDKLPAEANKAQVESWLKAHDLQVKAYDNKYQISLDRTPVEGGLIPVCESCFIHLEITLSAEVGVSKKEVFQICSCV